MNWIAPEVHARLRRLRLSRRQPSLERGSGIHLSRTRGSGLEFSQYRSYEPGDDPRRIDWKLYARSDRYLVREAERDSRLTLWVLIDATASMAQSDRARPHHSKLDAARAIAACAAELALRQNERFGLIGIHEDRPTQLPAGSGPRHRDRLHFELSRLQAGGHWPTAASLQSLWPTVEPGSLVLMLGDGFEDQAIAWAERLSGTQREVLAVHIHGADEQDFPFTGAMAFRDPETGALRRVDAGTARARYLERFAAARRARASRLDSAGVRHCEQRLDEPPDAGLARLLATGRRS